MEKPTKRDEKFTRPLIDNFVMHYVTNFGEYPTKTIVDRSIKAIIKKKQEEFISNQFHSWNSVDLATITDMVGERVMDLKEIEAKQATPITAAK